MSVIGNEFSGLPIADLIGGPLKAACDAQIRLAKATTDFINTVGFTPDFVPSDPNNPNSKLVPSGKLVPRQVDFSFWKPIPLDQKEVLATGSFTPPVLAAAGSVATITDDNHNDLLGQAVPIDQDPNRTATNVAAQINKVSTKYSASVSGSVITISAAPGSGASANARTITVTYTAPAPPAGGGAAPAAPANSVFPLAGGKDSGGEAQVQKVMLSVPFLAIVNVPALMVKTVDITFDMEVKSSESHKDDMTEQVSTDVTAKVDYGVFSAEVKIHAAVSAHQENTRSTDRSAKYHVAVHASDDGMPEGLSRVLDMLQKAIAPVGVSKPQTLDQANIGQNQKKIT